jgi:hypothetical protein
VARVCGEVGERRFHAVQSREEEEEVYGAWSEARGVVGGAQDLPAIVGQKGTGVKLERGVWRGCLTEERRPGEILDGELQIGSF